MNKAYIATGSNATSDWQTNASLLCNSMVQISESIGRITEASRLYRSAAFPEGSGPDFANMALVCETELSAEDVLVRLHQIEAEHGRERIARWGQRSLDLDLIALGDDILPDAQTVQTWINLPLSRQMEDAPAQLLLPHPRMQDRAFVLLPMADFAPNWRHPIIGSTVLEMLDALPKDLLDQTVPQPDCDPKAALAKLTDCG